LFSAGPVCGMKGKKGRGRRGKKTEEEGRLVSDVLSFPSEDLSEEGRGKIWGKGGGKKKGGRAYLVSNTHCVNSAVSNGVNRGEGEGAGGGRSVIFFLCFLF